MIHLYYKEVPHDCIRLFIDWFHTFLYLVQRGTLQQQEEALALFVIKSRTPALTRMMLFLQISVKHCPRSSYCYCFMFFQLHKLS